MLQFWKKTSSPKKIKNGSLQTNLVDQELSVASGPLSRFKYEGTSKNTCQPKSRLSLNIEDVLHNKIALSYLSQFMEAKGHSNLFNLLADLEGLPFRLQTLQRRSQSLTGSPTDESRIHPIPIKKIYEKYFSDESPFRIRLPDEIRASVYGALSSDQSDVRTNKLRETVYNLIRKEIWCDFLKSDWFCKYQIEVMTSGTMTLSDVLYNEPCLGAFIDFLEQEGLSLVIEFWLAATSFEKQYSSCTDSIDSIHIQNDAILLYDKYLSLQATSPLGLGDKTRFAVEEGICGETRTAPDCLRPAQVAVEAFLSRTCLRHFLSSQQYLGLLSDVMTTTAATSSVSKSNHSPASSVTDGSFEHSRASQAQQDPDGLWRRRKHNSGLSFGRIDQLGRYETDIEPEPEKKSESRISRVVKLLMNKDEQKAQEEMAWRVAEMIVKDITSITMGESNLDET